MGLGTCIDTSGQIFAEFCQDLTPCIFHFDGIPLELLTFHHSLRSPVKQVTFYLLSQSQSPAPTLSAEENLACELAANAWRNGKRVLIACDTEQQANRLDDALWARDPDEFVPHNLSGESTTYPTPIEISWVGKRNTQRRDLLISLQTQLPDFINSFTQIIDFVPVDETQKAQARERYKQYRQLGWKLETEQVE